MSKNQGDPDALLRVMSKALRKAFVNTVGDEEELADEALLQYAREHLLEEEHAEIAEIQINDPEKFMLIVSNMALKEPDFLALFLETTKRTYQDFRRQGPEGFGGEGRSPEKR